MFMTNQGVSLETGLQTYILHKNANLIKYACTYINVVCTYTCHEYYIIYV